MSSPRKWNFADFGLESFCAVAATVFSSCNAAGRRIRFRFFFHWVFFALHSLIGPYIRQKPGSQRKEDTRSLGNMEGERRSGHLSSLALLFACLWASCFRCTSHGNVARSARDALQGSCCIYRKAVLIGDVVKDTPCRKQLGKLVDVLHVSSMTRPKLQAGRVICDFEDHFWSPVGRSTVFACVSSLSRRSDKQLPTCIPKLLKVRAVDH